jgi:hypothetical protein
MSVMVTEGPLFHAAICIAKSNDVRHGQTGVEAARIGSQTQGPLWAVG